MLASVSIPVAFAPVRIEVNAAGKVYDELHGDGGTTRKVFIASLQLSLRSFRATVRRAAFAPIYIIANTLLVPELRPTEANLLAIAQSWLEAINKSHGAGDLFRLLAGET